MKMPNKRFETDSLRRRCAPPPLATQARRWQEETMYMDPQTLPTRDWVDYCQALLTPAIAALGILIALLYMCA